MGPDSRSVRSASRHPERGYGETRSPRSIRGRLKPATDIAAPLVGLRDMEKGTLMSVDRRDVLRTVGAATLVGLAGCNSGGRETVGNRTATADDYLPLGNYPVPADEVVFGANVPKSGTYVSEGEEQLRGFRLAQDHLNTGGGVVDLWSELSGEGVLGRTVVIAEGDTAATPAHARQQASSLIERDGAIMISGGSSSAVAVAVQERCQRGRVPFMACVTHANRTTGDGCVRYGFREMPNTAMTGRALATGLARELGSGLNFFQLYADYPWGREQRSAHNRWLTRRADWNAIGVHETGLGATSADYANAFERVPVSETDVLVLNYYGLDADTVLRAVRETGLDRSLDLVIPLFNRLLARVNREGIAGVYGTVPWNWQLRNDIAIAFVDSFRERYGQVPSYAAHLAYVQTLQFAAAAERAGTFYPPEVIAQLEGHTYDNAGLGSAETLRACDHQAVRDVLFVQGRRLTGGDTDGMFRLIESVSRSEVAYGCEEEPAVNCVLGPVR